LYLVIDSLLLVSIITLYAYLRRTPRWLSLPGCLLALVGAVLLVGHDVVDALGNLYAVAALLFAIGITLLALGSWVARALPRWTAFLIIASTVVGSIGYFVSAAGFLFVLSGVLFGLGLIGIGLNIWRKPSPPAPARP
jgi:drug/metabolite transporter (DMT)-like permease